MSFLEISLYAYEKPAKSAVKIAGFLNDEALSAAKRKAILKTGLLLLILSTVYYVFLSSIIVNNNRERVMLLKEYEAESIALDGIRSTLIEGRSALTVDYLGTLGYSETKNLNVIKRTNNVAGKSIQSFQ